MDHEHDRNQLERLVFSSDAVFAIAITLLVIEVHAPDVPSLTDAELGRALLAQFSKYIGFVNSFLVIGRFWVGHHQVIGLLRATSRKLVWANLLLLMTIAFMPFPSAVFSEYVQLRVGVGFYTGWLMLIGAVNRRVIRLALLDPALRRPDVDEAVVRHRIRTSWTPLLLGGAGFALGMIQPLLSLVGLLLGGAVIGPLMRRRERRLQRAA